MKNYIIAFTLCILFSCSIFQSAVKRDLIATGREFEDTLKVLWKYDSINQHYIEDKKFFFQSLSVPTNKYFKYLQTKDTSYVIKLLGRNFKIAPDTNIRAGYNKRITYMFTKHPCELNISKWSEFECKTLDFYFYDRDNRSKIKWVNFNIETANISH
ncbi:MAG: hypothetical protein ABI840_09755 [bacterium]